MTKNENSWPEDRIVPPIDQSIDLSEPYKNVENRYYSRFYHKQEDSQDQIVLVHTNRICLGKFSILLNSNINLSTYLDNAG